MPKYLHIILVSIILIVILLVMWNNKAFDDACIRGRKTC